MKSESESQLKGPVKVNRQHAAKISPVETNPENTHFHKIAYISSSRDDKSNL